MISTIGAIVQAITGRTELPKHTCLFYPKDGYSVGDVELDLILDESHSKSAVVTESPMEDGRAVSDGIIPLLRDGTLTALVSNHSLKHVRTLSAQTAEAALEEAQNDMTEGDNRARQAWEELKGVMDRRELVTIVTALEVYENVAITSIETSRDGESGDALEIRISFRQVSKVRLKEDKVSAQVQPKNMDSAVNRDAAVGINGGQQVGVDATEEEMKELVPGEV